MSSDEHYFALRARQELDMAALAGDSLVKTLHLNMAARYAALRERAEAEENSSGNLPTGVSAQRGRP